VAINEVHASDFRSLIFLAAKEVGSRWVCLFARVAQRNVVRRGKRLLPPGKGGGAHQADRGGRVRHEYSSPVPPRAHRQRSEPHLRHLSPATGSPPNSPGAPDGHVPETDAHPFPQPDPPRLQGVGDVALGPGEGGVGESGGPRAPEAPLSPGQGVRFRSLPGQHGPAEGLEGEVAGGVPQSAGRCLAGGEEEAGAHPQLHGAQVGGGGLFFSHTLTVNGDRG